jgi:hypothetical protein
MLEENARRISMRKITLAAVSATAVLSAGLLMPNSGRDISTMQRC